MLSFGVPIVFLTRVHIMGDEPTEMPAEHPSDAGSLESAAELSLGGYFRPDAARSSSHSEVVENCIPPMLRAALSRLEGLGSLFRCDGEEACPSEEELEDVTIQAFDEPWTSSWTQAPAWAHRGSEERRQQGEHTSSHRSARMRHHARPRAEATLQQQPQAASAAAVDRSSAGNAEHASIRTTAGRCEQLERRALEKVNPVEKTRTTTHTEGEEPPRTAEHGTAALGVSGKRRGGGEGRDTRNNAAHVE